MIVWHDFNSFKPTDYHVYIICFIGSRGGYTPTRSFMYVSNNPDNPWGAGFAKYGRPIKITEFPEYGKP